MNSKRYDLGSINIIIYLVVLTVFQNCEAVWSSKLLVFIATEVGESTVALSFCLGEVGFQISSS